MEAPYRDEFHAILRAFSSHEGALMSQPRFFYDAMVSTADIRRLLQDDGLTKLDRLIQDQYAKNLLIRELSKEDYALLAAKYSSDADEKLQYTLYLSGILGAEFEEEPKARRINESNQYRLYLVLGWADYPLPAKVMRNVREVVPMPSRASVTRDRYVLERYLNTREDHILKYLQDTLKEKGFI